MSLHEYQRRRDFARAGGDILDERPESVDTGRDLDAIAAGRSRPKKGSGGPSKVAARTTSPAKAATTKSTVAGVELSHPDRVLYPEQGLTKLDLGRYYERVEEWILPHVARRPLTLVRCPRGRARACFYQKHLQEGAPAAVRPVPIVEANGERSTYLMVEDLAGIVSLVQLGVLELHVWGSSVDHLEQPDRLVFDIDPAPDLPWRRVAGAARAVRDRLAKVGLESWLKTTGGKGLHVVVPVQPDTDWAIAKGFCHAVVESLMEEHPDLYVIQASKAARRGKVFLDYLRNSRGATAVAAFSSRARPGAPVSMPLRWDELRGTAPPAHTVVSAPKRMARLREDPWKGFWKTRQSLQKVPGL